MLLPGRFDYSLQSIYSCCVFFLSFHTMRSQDQFGDELFLCTFASVLTRAHTPHAHICTHARTLMKRFTSNSHSSLLYSARDHQICCLLSVSLFHAHMLTHVHYIMFLRLQEMPPGHNGGWSGFRPTNDMTTPCAANPADDTGAFRGFHDELIRLLDLCRAGEAIDVAGVVDDNDDSGAYARSRRCRNMHIVWVPLVCSFVFMFVFERACGSSLLPRSTFIHDCTTIHSWLLYHSFMIALAFHLSSIFSRHRILPGLYSMPLEGISFRFFSFLN
jgi:hypothetical protein